MQAGVNAMSIYMDLNDPNIKTKIAELPEKMLEYAEEVLSNQCDVIVGLAKVYVPVDTGSLRDSIRKERGGTGKEWREFKVRAGGYVTNPRTGRRVDYAWIVELRTPFLSTAVEEVKPTIQMMIEAAVVEKCNE
jgi:hypothetical protein